MTGDTVQVDGEVGRVLRWKIDYTYLVRFSDGREMWYAEMDLTMVRMFTVKARYR